MTPPKTLTLTELAEHLGCTKRTLYRKIRSGEFPVEPIKGLQPRMWLTADIDNWLTGGKND